MEDFIKKIIEISKNYEERKVDFFNNGVCEVSTVSVTDGNLEFETAISHPNYNDGELIVIQAYATKELAQKGHDNWIKIMTSDSLPDKIRDCGNFFMSQILFKLDPDVRIVENEAKIE